MIIVTSDHGEAFGEHLVVGHGVLLHEVEVVVPLIVKLPHSDRIGAKDNLVQHVDLLPTVLDLLGLAQPAQTQVRSMLAPGRGEAYVMERARESNVRMHRRFDRDKWAVYHGSRKYTEFLDGTKQLYDLADGREELKDTRRGATD